MIKKLYLNLTLLFALMIGFKSFNQVTKFNKQDVSIEKNDTTIVKHKNDLKNSRQVGILSKSYNYYWLVGNDTLDFLVNAIQFQKDSTIHLNIIHNKPIIFKTALIKITECLTQVKEDFSLTKLNSIYFRDPIYYLDFSKDISKEYRKQFGEKIINNDQLNQFILQSNLNKQIDNLISPFDKKVKRYSIEKFHLTAKNQLNEYLIIGDLTEYPEFVMNGIGFYLQLENLKE